MVQQELKFGKYRVEKVLGKGGMGVVYLAFDAVLERQVAIKTVTPSKQDLQVTERFTREARTAAKLNHPNVVTVFDFGIQDEQLFIVMEYVEGEDLETIISEKRLLDIDKKLDIIRQVCLALDYAHKADVFHRDIKPGNIRIATDGTVKIVDFGLAIVHASNLTRSDAIVGTPMYTAPERLMGKKSDGRTDQFSIGLVLYELLTYNRPFDGESLSTIIFKILNEEPQGFEPKLKAKYPEFEYIIKKAIMKDPEYRYPTLKEMADDIDALQYKVRRDGFSMKEPVEVTLEPLSAGDILLDKEDDALHRKKTIRLKRGRHTPSQVTAVISIFVVLVLIAVLVFVVFKKDVPPPPPGILVFDAQPYARIESLKRLPDSRPVRLEQDEKETPLRITLPPGEYEIIYSHPFRPDEKDTKKITIESGQTLHLDDFVDSRFVEAAVKYFSILP